MEAQPVLKKLHHLNMNMQAFFAEWNTLSSKVEPSDVYLNFMECEYMSGLNVSLTKKIPAENFLLQIKERIADLFNAGNEIITRVSQSYPQLEKYKKEGPEPATRNEYYNYIYEKVGI